MAAQAEWLRRMAESRSDGLWNRHRCAVLEDDGSARRSRSVRDRRGGGRNRMARRLQFPVGMVERMVRGERRLTSRFFEHTVGEVLISNSFCGVVNQRNGCSALLAPSIVLSMQSPTRDPSVERVGEAGRTSLPSSPAKLKTPE